MPRPAQRAPKIAKPHIQPRHDASRRSCHGLAQPMNHKPSSPPPPTTHIGNAQDVGRLEPNGDGWSITHQQQLNDATLQDSSLAESAKTIATPGGIHMAPACIGLPFHSYPYQNHSSSSYPWYVSGTSCSASCSCSSWISCGPSCSSFSLSSWLSGNPCGISSWPSWSAPRS